MVCRIGASAAIGSVALDDGPVHFMHEVLYQGRLEEIVASRLSCTYLHSHLPFCRASEGLIDFHQSLGSYLLCHIDSGLSERRHRHRKGKK